MKSIKRVPKTIFVLFVLIFLPAVFFTIYEYRSLKNNEQVITDVYQQQMDALLFAVNQHIWNDLESRIQKLELLLQMTGQEQYKATFASFFKSGSPITAIALFDSGGSFQNQIDDAIHPVIDNHRIKDIERLLKANRLNIEKLIQLRAKGYRKMENIVLPALNKVSQQDMMLYFILEKKQRLSVVVITLDRDMMIRNTIWPKLSEVAKNRFDVNLFDNNGRSLDNKRSALNLSEVAMKRKLWIFPNLNIGMRVKGVNLLEVSHLRFYQNMILIVIMEIILILGAWFVARTLRKEIRLTQLKSDFVSNVSHELRTPLSSIRMFAESLEMERVKDKAKRMEYYQNISQEAERLTQLINSILSFSRMESGQKHYHIKRLDINQLVTAISDRYRPQLELSGFKFSVQLYEKPLFTLGDNAALTEVIINLLDNAKKYSSSQKEISIRTARKKDFVFFEIRDKGIGVAPENHSRIFEKFYRDSSALVHNTKGSGLGLSIVTHIIKDHKGSIELDSAPGKGSCFRVLLPQEGN